jgi:hypothetical protein
MRHPRKVKAPAGIEKELVDWVNDRNSAANEQTPNRRCQFCGEGLVCQHGYCEVCQRCKGCIEEAKEWARSQPHTAQ